MSANEKVIKMEIDSKSKSSEKPKEEIANDEEEGYWTKNEASLDDNNERKMNETTDIALHFQNMSKQLKKGSVLEIEAKKHIAKDEMLPGGLYDPKLGPIRKGQKCGHCNRTDCIGHFGHISLPDKFLNPLFKNVVKDILNMVCDRCYSIQLEQIYARYFIAQFFLLRTCDFDRFFQLDHWSSTDAEYLLQSHALVSNVEIEMAKVKYVRQQNATKMTEIQADELMRKMKNFLSKKKICLDCKDTRKVYRVTDYGLQARTVKEKWKTDVIFAIQPRILRKLMRNIWKKEEMFLRQYCPVLNTSRQKYPTDMFFMDTILVIPNMYRLPNRVDDHYIMHPRSTIYQRIIVEKTKMDALLAQQKAATEPTEPETEPQNKSKRVRTLRPTIDKRSKTIPNEKQLAFACGRLQIEIDKLLDSSARSFGGGGVAGMALNTSQNVLKSESTTDGGLKQLLEHKEGMLRNLMMGKRANYSGRSVITPDPCIDVDEIGIPFVFARELTIPVKINHLNRFRLRRLVLNGPDVYPGANFIEDHRGVMIAIPSNSDPNGEEKRRDLSCRLDYEIRHGEPLKGKIVHRHMVNGDYLLVNRQPTLHKSSMLAFRAYIYRDESRTIRLNYAACKGFNADFDGDEINIHCPQFPDARNELRYMCALHMNYFSPRDGKPIVGLIQDHVIAAVHLTSEDRFFNFAQYKALVWSAFRLPPTNPIRYLRPAIVRPQTLWTGKQVFSTVLMSILYETNPNRKFFSFASKSTISFGSPIGRFDDKYVYFSNCELLVGLIDSKNIGSSITGLIHRVQYLYGNKVWPKVLSGFSRMLTHYCKVAMFSFSATNAILTKKAAKKRATKLNKIEDIGQEIAREVLDLPDDSKLSTEETNKLLCDEFVRNPKFQQKFDKVSKKKIAESMQPLADMLTKSECLLDNSSRNQLKTMIMSGAKGKPQNLLQMTMAVGQIDLEGKRPALNRLGRTLPCFKPFDPNPVASGFVANSYCSGLNEAEFEFVATAGREGLVDTAVKTSRSGYLQRSLIKGLENLRVDYHGMVRDSDGTVIQHVYGEDGLDCTKTEFLKYEHFDWLIQNADILLSRYFHPDKVVWIPDLDKTVHKYWKKLKKHNNKLKSTLFNDFSPRSYFGSCSDKMLEAIERKVSELKNRNDTCDENAIIKRFRNLIYSLLYFSQVEPGTAVGITAAQSLGEPSTQMTLNTFHMAGNSDQNVTLGIPQLIELLQHGSRNRKNTYMEVLFRQNLDDFEQISQRLLVGFQKVKLSEVLKLDGGGVQIRKSATDPNKFVCFFARMNVSSDFCLKLSPEVLMTLIVKKYLSKLINCLVKRTKPKTKSKRQTRIRVKIEDDDVERADGAAAADADHDDNDADYNSDNEDHEIGYRNFAKNAKSAKSKTTDFESIIDDMACEDDCNDFKDDVGSGGSISGNDDDDNDNDDNDANDDVKTDKNNGFGSDNDNDDDNDDDKSSDSSQNLDDYVRDNYKVVQHFKYDAASYKWLEFELELPVHGAYGNVKKIFDSVAQSMIVNKIAGIDRALIYENNDGRSVFRTEGVNFFAITEHFRYFDLNTIHSNDIHTIREYLGVCAARACLIREIRSVYAAYNITIDYRHYSLIADYMFNSGNYLGFNRHGLKCCASPFQRITHETALANLTDAIVQDKYDSSYALSANVMLGQPLRIGTGYCKLLGDNKLYEKLLIQRLYAGKRSFIQERDSKLNLVRRPRTFEDDREEIFKALFGKFDPIALPEERD